MRDQRTEQRFDAAPGSAEPVHRHRGRIPRKLAQLPVEFLKSQPAAFLINRHKGSNQWPTRFISKRGPSSSEMAMPESSTLPIQIREARQTAQGILTLL